MKNRCRNRLIGLFTLLVGHWYSANAAIETIPTGSFIINMGVVPQTYGNGIRPFGMIHDLLKNYKVQIRWVINQSKLKDGIDFTYNGVNYQGGTFIILAKYRTTSVDAAITYWQTQGVIGITTTSPFSVDVTYNLKYSPRWTFDFQNGNIALNFLSQAGIPTVTYPKKVPAELDACDDLFVMPHADPTWLTHSNLLNWNLSSRGWIWAGCHAVSVLENLFNPGNPATKMNFLSQTGLVPFGSHADGSPPYSYRYPTDPEMQFMGVADGAMQNGSERIFLPSGSTWRPGAKVAAYDPTQANVPGLSPGEAAAIVYGRAFDDDQRGKVMYTGGHNIEKGTADAVAAMRAFFNFSFLSIYDKVINFVVLGQISLIELNNYTYRASLPLTVNPNNYSYQWTSTCGGTFSNPTDSVTLFTAPAVGSCKNCTLYCTITDSCGRQYYQEHEIVICPAATLAVNLVRFSGTKSGGNNQLQWTVAAESPLHHFELEYSTDGNTYTKIADIQPQAGTGLLQYNYLHQQVFGRTAFYRLKIYENNGSYTYSDILQLRRDKTRFSVDQVFPNPFAERITLQLDSPDNAAVEVRLTDMQGKTLRRESIALVAGTNKIEWTQLDPLPSGFYLLKIQNSEINTTIKLLKSGN